MKVHVMPTKAQVLSHPFSSGACITCSACVFLVLHNNTPTLSWNNVMYMYVCNSIMQTFAGFVHVADTTQDVHNVHVRVVHRLCCLVRVCSHTQALSLSTCTCTLLRTFLAACYPAWICLQSNLKCTDKHSTSANL